MLAHLRRVLFRLARIRRTWLWWWASRGDSILLRRGGCLSGATSGDAARTSAYATSAGADWCGVPVYSDRRAIMGSTLVARRAGPRQAAVATAVSARAAAR